METIIYALCVSYCLAVTVLATIITIKGRPLEIRPRFPFLFVLVVALMGCKKDSPEPPKQFPRERIQWNDYVDPNGNGVDRSGTDYTMEKY